jgi:AmmeMemoRadiSam system protein A
MFSETQKKELLALARQAIASRFNKEPVIYPDDEAFSISRGVFVTLHKKRELRGCIGYIKGFKDLVPSIVEMSQSAAFQDPRFPHVKQEELAAITIEISVLSEMELVNEISDIVIGRDGLFLNHPYGSGLLLPQVPVEWNWDLATFLREICYKAGLVPDSWKDEKAKLYRFSAEIFSDDEQNSD